jgi:capsid assembly protease
MKYIRVVTQFANSIWAIQQDKFLEIRDFLLFKAAGGNYAESDITARIGAKAKREAPSSGAIAVIPVYGVVSQRVSMMDEISGSGSASTERITQDFRTALADPAVSAIVLDVDSPGGTVFGVTELANEIYKARGKKPVVSIANSLAASAAYWIASAAEEFNITPGGEAGSIGVFAEHTDISKWLETEGIKPTLISAGEFKVEGNSYQPLGEEAAAFIQSRVNDYYGMFVDAVARNRGVTATKVRKDFGGGRVFGADQAIASGMADKIATFDQIIHRLGGSSASSRAEADHIAPVAVEESPKISAVINADIERRRLELLGY